MTGTETTGGLLAEWAGLYESSRRRAIALAAGLGAEPANWRPEEGRWSIAECIDHLAVSMTTYLECMEPAVERARAKGRTGAEPYARGTLLGRFILWGMRGGPARLKVKAPKVFRPRPGALDPDEALRGFTTALDRMLALLARAEGLPLGRVKFATPVGALVRVSLAQAFEIHARHNHRHLDQAEAVRASEGFPA